MSKVVQLSTGESVHLRDKFTHGAEKAYYRALHKDSVEKEYIDGKIVRETPTANSNDAIEAALLAMIEKVIKGETEMQASPAWLDDLGEVDYEAIAKATIEIRKEGRKGKKNS